MTKEEFAKAAEECGYRDDEIKDLIDLCKETKTPYEEIPLIERIYD